MVRWIGVFGLVLVTVIQQVKSDIKWQTNLVGGSATGSVLVGPFVFKVMKGLANFTSQIMKRRFDKVWQDLTFNGQECKNDMYRLFNGFNEGDKWAIQTWDSWGKLGNGLLEGYGFVRGRMSLCTKARPPQLPDYSNQFCWLDITLHNLESYPIGGPRMGFCLPKSCSYDQINRLITYPQGFYNWIPYAPYIRVPFCYSPHTDHFSTTGESVSIIVCIICFTLLGLGTVYDLWLRLSKWCRRESPESKKLSNPQKQYKLIEEADGKGKLSSETTMFVIEENEKDEKSEKDEIELYDAKTLIKAKHRVRFQEINEDSSETEVEIKNAEPDPQKTSLLCFREPKIKIFKQPGLFGSIFLSFSLVTNFINLFKITNETNVLSCLNGIRVFSTGWVVMGHTFTHLYPNGDNPLGVSEMVLRQKMVALSMGGGIFGVDSFFVLSGILGTYIFMRDRQIGRKLSWFRFYIDRYMRLSPANFFMLFVLFYGLLGNNPQGPSDFFLDGMKKICRSNWWYYVLYINNFLDPECFGIDWYLGNDMQFFWLSPIFLLLFMFIGKKVGYIFLGLIFASVGISWKIVSDSNFANGFNLFYRPKLFPHQVVLGPLYHTFYIRPYCRIGSYLIGMYIGYLIQTIDFTGKISKLKMNLLWAATFFCLGFSIYFTLVDDHLPDKLLYIYVSSGHYIWSLGVGLMIFLCATGYGGIINSFLSWPGWQPLSKLSYSVYLMHFTAMKLFYFHTEETFHVSVSDLIVHFSSLIQYDFLGAMFLYFVIEAPFINLWRFTKNFDVIKPQTKE